MGRRIYWDCKRYGCYLKKKVVKLHEFDECFHGNCGMTDIDGLIEINGHFSILEWKTPGEVVQKGQEIMLKRLTQHPNFTAVVAEGCAERMLIESALLVQNGVFGNQFSTDINQLKEFYKSWHDAVCVPWKRVRR